MPYNINLKQYPDFYDILFGMWYANRRSIEKPVRIIEKLLDDDLENTQQNPTPRSVSRKQRLSSH
jgi:hypothetical protein